MRLWRWDEQTFNGLKLDYNEAALRLEAEELEAMLHRLPEVTCRVFNLYAIDGYKHKEISAMLSISEGTSKWHLSVARKKLKKMISERLNNHAKPKRKINV